jgi:hypothetical protein
MELATVRFATFFVVCLVAGCASYSYVEPTSGNRARVRFVTDTVSPSTLKVYDGPDCSGAEHEWMRLRVGPLITGSLKRLGMPLWNYHDNAAKEVYVATDKPLSAIFWGTENAGTMEYSCGVPFFATLQKDKDYEIRYRWARRECTVSLFEIRNATTGEPVFLEIAHYNNKVLPKWDGCYKAFHRFRLD